MPTWLLCKSCGEKYYTAKSKYNFNRNEKCQKCRGEIAPIYNNVDQLIKKGTILEFEFSSRQNGRKAYFEIINITENTIYLSYKNGDFKLSEITSFEDFQIYIGKKSEKKGRYYFESKILNYNQKEGILVIEKPEFIFCLQERKEPRFKVDTRVHFYIYEEDSESDIINIENIFASANAVDLSLNGIYINPDKNLKEVSEKQKIFLKFDLENINLDVNGEIARIKEPTDNNKKIGIGIEFSNLNEKQKTLVRQIQMLYL